MLFWGAPYYKFSMIYDIPQSPVLIVEAPILQDFGRRLRIDWLGKAGSGNTKPRTLIRDVLWADTNVDALTSLAGI